MSVSTSGEWNATTDLSNELPDSGAETGTGADMPIWAADRSVKLSALINGEYSDESSYGLPDAAILSGDWDVSFSESETYHEEPDGTAESGLSDTVLDVWDADRQTKLQTLITDASYMNASAYSVGTGAVPNGDWDMGTFEGEQMHGKSETGVEVGYTYLGTRASGTVVVTDSVDDPTDLAVISGVTLYSTDGTNEFTAPADAETGEYELPLSTGGEYTIEARHPLLPTATTTVEPADGESVPNTDIVMELPSGFGGLARGRRIG